MKRKTKALQVLSIAALLMILSLTNLNAQHFNKGDIDVNATIGFFNPYNYGATWDTKMSMPPLALSVDYGLRDDWGPGVFSVGGYIGMSSYKYDYSYAGYDDKYKYNSLIFGGRATYHYEFTDKLDTYGGVVVGLRVESGKYKGDNPYYDTYDWDYSQTHVAFDPFVGAKYYFNDKVAVMSEIGYLIGWINIGVGLKF